MKRTCIKCKKELASKDKRSVRRIVTQVICRDCLEQINKGRLKTAKEILDSFGLPILLLDNQYRIRAANKLAQKITGRPLPDIENCLPGEVLECINSRQPGGCGQTVHCQACALRMTVAKTMANDQGFEKVPAYQDYFQENGTVARRLFFISTEKLTDFILIRIDEVETIRTMQTTRKQPSPETSA